MRCFGGVAEYGLTAPDYAEFFAHQPGAAKSEEPLSTPALPRRQIPLCSICRESLEAEYDPEAIIAGLLLAGRRPHPSGTGRRLSPPPPNCWDLLTLRR